jgi:polyisoprenoid-binding protein YceI
VLDVEYRGWVRDPWGHDRAGFSATATVNREDWGLTWNTVLDSGSLLVSKHIELEIEIELIRQ